jgi:hypothetical protein
MEPSAIIEVRSSYCSGPPSKTVTDMVAMKTRKFRPKVPMRNSIRRTPLSSGRAQT